MKLKQMTALASAVLLSSGVALAQSHDVSGNASFEAWHDYTVDTVNLSAPNGWQGSDSLITVFAPYGLLNPGNPVIITPQKQVFKSSDAHTGQAATQLLSKNIGDLGVQPGSFTNGNIAVDIIGLMGGGDPSTFGNYLTYSGGEEVSQPVASVSAWMKNGGSVNTDNYEMRALALKKVDTDSFIVIGEGTKSVAPNLTEYTEVTVDLSYPDPNVVPDRLVVVFSSVGVADSPKTEDNSVLVDDVSYTLGTTGIKIPLMSEDAMMVYPVPATDKVYFNLKSSVQPSDYTLKITNLEGRVISQETLSQQVNAKEVSSWAKGMYFYQLTDLRTNQQQTGKFILE